VKIKAFARETMSSTFPLFDKVNVNGPHADEVFKFLRFNSELNQGDHVMDIHFNFCKFLVDLTANTVHYFSHLKNYKKVEKAVKFALK
jgi:glutathione peroxidase